MRNLFKPVYIFLMLFLVSPVQALQSSEAFGQQDNFFTFTILVPDTRTNDYGTISSLLTTFNKIHINTTIVCNNWGYIFDRTFNYPIGHAFDYIPPYEGGGYDALLISWVSDLDWDISDLFSTSALPPNGHNVYQFSNDSFDNTAESYQSEFNNSLRAQKSSTLQHILYEELPSIPIIYTRSLLAKISEVSGIDWVLLNLGEFRPEYWISKDNVSLTITTLVNPFHHYNIFKYDGYYDALWMQAVYGRMFVRAQGTHRFVPQIATGYELFPDNNSIRININPSARFSNGDPVTADDIKYSYELYMNFSLTPFASHPYDLIPQFIEDYSSIKVVNNHTITFTLKKFSPFAFEIFTCGIIEKSLVQPLLQQYGTQIFDQEPFSDPIGTALVNSCGPYVLEDINDTEIILRASPYYVGNEPHIDRIILTQINQKSDALEALKTGNVDIVDASFMLTLEDLHDLTNIVPIIVENPTLFELALNLRHPYFGTGELTPTGTPEAAKAIRKALAHAIPRDEIVNKLGEEFATQAGSHCPIACIDHDFGLQPYSYDTELALEFLNYAGYNVTHTETSQTNTFTSGLNTILIWSFLGIASIVLSISRDKKKY